MNGAAPGLVLRRLVEHRGLLHLDDRTARQLAGDVRALADAAAVNASELERHLARCNLQACAVETELGPAVLLRDVERILADGAS